MVGKINLNSEMISLLRTKNNQKHYIYEGKRNSITLLKTKLLGLIHFRQLMVNGQEN
jgi:hypothetical protein